MGDFLAIISFIVFVGMTIGYLVAAFIQITKPIRSLNEFERKNNMNKKMFATVAITTAFATIITLVGAYFLFLQPCDHQWEDATCTAPVTCSLCGETAGNPLDHHWVDPDCVTPKTCSDCALTNGNSLGHSWIAVDCTTPKTCNICMATEGEPLGHDWLGADCVTPKTCDICGETAGSPLGHDWIEATYEAPKTCSVCGDTEGDPLTKPIGNSDDNYGGGSGDDSTPGRNCVICGGSVSRSDTLYCSTHDCACGGCPNSAKNANGAWGSYCAYHSCQDYNCLSTPIGGTSYCGAHGG